MWDELLDSLYSRHSREIGNLLAFGDSQSS